VVRPGGKPSLGQQFESAFDRYPYDTRLAIDPAVTVEHTILVLSKLLEGRARNDLETRIGWFPQSLVAGQGRQRRFDPGLALGEEIEHPPHYAVCGDRGHGQPGAKQNDRANLHVRG